MDQDRRSDALYCSAKCRVAAHRDRSRDADYTAQENESADEALAALSAQPEEPPTVWEVQALRDQRNLEAVILAHLVAKYVEVGAVEFDGLPIASLVDDFVRADKRYVAALDAADAAHPYDSDPTPLG